MDLGISGLASGFDWRTFVDKMVEVERAPQATLLNEQTTIEQKKIAYGSINTQLAVLQKRIDALKEPDFFSSRTVESSDEKLASATAGASAPLGKFDFNVTQLASSAKLNGTSDVGAAIAGTSDVSAVLLNSAGFSKAATAGKFTVNGSQITVDPEGTLQDVFSAIETATGGNVTAGYDPVSDTITLSATTGELVLGSATDTSNFLSVAKLYNNGTSATTSNGSLGGVKRSAPLAAGNFGTPIDDGGAGTGAFTVNGVSISYSASADSLDNVLKRINDSTAGVIASYDSVNDRVVLTNKETGDTGIFVQDVTGNFAAAVGLTTGALDHGKNLEYSVNNGGTLISYSNTIGEETSGIAGLNVTAIDEGTFSISVGSDSAKIKTAITDFITEYNKTQSLIDTNTASSTDAKGKVTAGTLSDESDASAIAAQLRSAAYAALDGFAASMNQLADLGIVTNGNDNSLELDDEEALDAALGNDLSGVAKLFTDSTSGIAVKLSKYVDKLAGEEGSLSTKDTKLAKDIADIDTQISDMERLVLSNRQTLIDGFVQMETVQAQISQQLQFLSQRFGTSAASPSLG